MRTNGEIAHDAQMVATLRRCADALDAIAGTLAAMHDMLKPLAAPPCAEPEVPSHD